MVKAALHFEYEHRLLQGDALFDRFFGDKVAQLWMSLSPPFITAFC
jgi:hypothetical protein